MGVRVFLLLLLLHVTQSKVLELTCSQIRQFVDGHNSYRLQLAKGEIPNQPAASEMKKMVWDDELAAKAAKWASNNKFAHNPDRSVESQRFNTGENIYFAGSTNTNFAINVNSPMESWFSEYKDFKYGPLTAAHFKDSKKQIGHYTQMAWWNSVYLGCGISENFEKGMKVYYVVCNYGPSGNYINQAPYKAAGASVKLTCTGDVCDRIYGDSC